MLPENLFFPMPTPARLLLMFEADDVGFKYAFPNHGLPRPNSLLVMKLVTGVYDEYLDEDDMQSVLDSVQQNIILVWYIKNQKRRSNIMNYCKKINNLDDILGVATNWAYDASLS